MWCFSCFKRSSTSEDPFEAETDLALAVSRVDVDIQEARELASAIEESSRLHQREEEEAEKLRRRELENDEQIAHACLYDEGEMQLDALEEDEQRAMIVAGEEQVNKDEEYALILQESLNMVEPPPSPSPPPPSRAALLEVEDYLAKEKGKGKQVEGEQVKKDKELALILQESLNMVEPPPPSSIEEERKSTPRRAALDVKEKGKGKLIEDEQVKSDEQLAVIVQESLNMVEPPPTELEEKSNIEQRVIWESLKKGKGQVKDEVEEDKKLPKINPPPPPSMCGGCNTEIEHESSVVDVLGVLFHPECLWCDACHKPIADNHVSNARGKFHNACYERYCYVCEEKKMRRYNHHPFWKERYCSAHEFDGTPKCCSCERLEPKGRNYVKLGDGRWLCLECMESAVMDTDEALPLHFEIRHFFEGLNMKIEKAFPFLLVEKQALNKAEKEEKIDYNYEVVTRGICLSEEQTVTSVSKRPRMGPHNQLIDMVTESQRVPRNCEVTAVLILYGLPRLMTGYILAHEMMHAYLRLKGHRNLDHVEEEGICQVLGHMWLESQTYATIDATAASSSSHTRAGAGAATASKKGACSAFEKKLVEFCKNQIETDDSPVYGVGFRKVNERVSNSSLQETFKKIVRHRG